MSRRIIIFSCLLIAVVAGVGTAWLLSHPATTVEDSAGSGTYTLLFQPGAALVLVAAFVGMLFRAWSRRAKPGAVCRDGKVLRHDARMFLAHWCVALAVLMMAISGLLLGPLFLPRLVHTPDAAGFALNVHFAGILLFAFGLGYYISDLTIDGGLKELLPGSGDVRAAIGYYAAKLTGDPAPPQGKFLASEKLAFPVWMVLIAGITVTGLIKLAAHLWSLPGAFLGATTWLHDIFTLAIVVMLALHVLLGAVVPWSWPLLRSMVTGYMPEEYVRRNHGRWYQEIRKV